MKIFNWKYRYFRNKINGVKRTILDLEFKRYKLAELREESREEYDNLKSRRVVLQNKIDSEKTTPTMEQGDIARLDDDLVRLNIQIESKEAQLKALDMEMHGSKQTAEYPDGAQGVDQTIDALHELVAMLESYIKNNI